MTTVVPLAELRQQIDDIDQNILTLINRRAAVAMDVAKTKIAAGEAGTFYRPDREALVLRRIKDLNDGPLADDTAVRFFREIMSACLAMEKPLDVVFLGPEGTFTQQAAFKHFGHAVKTTPAASIDEIFTSVENGYCQFGVVPVENSTEGVISNTLDRFVLSPLQICGEVSIRIHHNLLGNVKDFSEIKQVYSHQQSLAQCQKWLDKNIPHVSRKAVSSNAEATKIAASEDGAVAIAGLVAADIYEVNVLASRIEDQLDNTTRFLIIGTQTADSTGNDKTTLMITTGNQPGALHKILQPFAEHGITMTRIESRPSRQGIWDYVFFIDLEGHRTDQELTEALSELKHSVNMLKILGSYPKAVL